MAEGGPIHQEAAIATVQVTCTSSGPISVDCKEEPIEGNQPDIEPLTIVIPPPAPPSTPVPVPPLGPVFHTSTSPWAGPNPVVSPLLPNLSVPQRPQLPPIAETFSGTGRFQAPTKWQEAFNLYTLHEDTNSKARVAYQNGCITFAAAQRIYLANLQDVRRLTAQGKLATCYLTYMLNYGKFYNYIDRHINS